MFQSNIVPPLIFPQLYVDILKVEILQVNNLSNFFPYVDNVINFEPPLSSEVVKC